MNPFKAKARMLLENLAAKLNLVGTAARQLVEAGLVPLEDALSFEAADGFRAGREQTVEGAVAICEEEAVALGKSARNNKKVPSFAELEAAGEMAVRKVAERIRGEL